MQNSSVRFFKSPNFYLLYIASGMLILGSCKTTAPISGEQVQKPEAGEVYTETIPLTDISFDMVLIPEGSYMMGSPASEANMKADEGPMKEVALDAFYMGKYELGWEIFELFFKQNQRLFQTLESDKLNAVDAITRPSPPYEDPSYGMGKAGYPAISMSTYSALVFCKWLSTVTGRFYRLPTEAEWEYAAKAGT